MYRRKHVRVPEMLQLNENANYSKTSKRLDGGSDGIANNKGTSSKFFTKPLEQFKKESSNSGDNTKPQSTSNISLVKRRLIKFFQLSASLKHTDSRNDLRLLEMETSELTTLKEEFCKTQIKEYEKHNPSLHSKTQKKRKFFMSNMRTLANEKYLPTNINSSALSKKFANFRRTNSKFKNDSKKIQATVMAPTFSAVNHSSLEYFPQHSLESNFSKLTEPIRNHRHHSHAEISQCSQEDKRKIQTHSDNNLSATDIRLPKNNIKINSNFHCSAWNNKDELQENPSTSICSTTTAIAPQVELGVQLIRALMKTECIEKRLKKRLVRNVVKKITRVANSQELEFMINKTTLLISPISDKNNSKKKKNLNNHKEKLKKEKSIVYFIRTKMNELTTKIPNKDISIDSNFQQDSSDIIGHNSFKALSNANQIQRTSCSPQNDQGLFTPKNNLNAIEATTSKDTKDTTEMIKTSNSRNIAGSTIVTRPFNTSATSLSLKNSMSSSPIKIQFALSIPEVFADSLAMTNIKTFNSKTILSTANECSQTVSSIPHLSNKVTKANNPEKNKLSVKTDNLNELNTSMTQNAVKTEHKKILLDQCDNETLTSTKTDQTTNLVFSNEINWIDNEITRLQNLRHYFLDDQPIIEKNTNIYDALCSKKELTKKLSTKKNCEDQYIQTGIPVKDVQLTEKKSLTRFPEKQESSTHQDHIKNVESIIENQETENTNSFLHQQKYEFTEQYANQNPSQYDHMQQMFSEYPTTSSAAVGSSAIMNINQFPQNKYTYCPSNEYSIPPQMQYYQPTSFYTYPSTPQQLQNPYPFFPTETPTSQSNQYYFMPNTETETLPTRTTCVNFASKTTRFENIDNINKIKQTSSSTVYGVSTTEINSKPPTTTTTTSQYDDVILGTNAESTIDYGGKPNVASQQYDSLQRSRPMYDTYTPPLFNYDRCMQVTTCTASYGETSNISTQTKPESVAYSIQFLTSKATTNGNIKKQDTCVEGVETIAEEPEDRSRAW